MALNQSLVGKTYSTVTTEVTSEAIQKYARACNDENPRYLEPSSDEVIAPPMFNTVVTWLALITTISDPELRVDLLRLLHRSQEMEFFVPIRLRDWISATASITSIESGPGGETLTIGLDASNQEHQLVSRTRFTALIRGRRERENLAQSASPGNSTTSRAPLLAFSQTIDLDQTTRYAEASGDRNPIHLDPAVARMAGLPGIVVHGLCTMAFSSKVVVDNLCGEKPERLKRLAVVFSRPVFPGDTITTTIWREDDRDGRMCYAFEACNSSGVVVLRDGIAEVL